MSYQNDNIDYHSKYLKYKKKYLDLQSKIGGAKSKGIESKGRTPIQLTFAAQKKYINMFAYGLYGGGEKNQFLLDRQLTADQLVKAYASISVPLAKDRAEAIIKSYGGSEATTIGYDRFVQFMDEGAQKVKKR